MNYRSIRDYNVVYLSGAAFACATAMMALTGCENVDPAAGYTSKQLYRTDVRTVCVEMFQAETFRRGIEYDLTRALAQQLELHSPYKVVADRRKADTVLYGTIGRVNETVLAQQRELDRPMINELTVFAKVTWEDLRTGERFLDDMPVRASGSCVKTLGAGVDSAAKEAAEHMALEIVQAMERPW